MQTYSGVKFYPFDPRPEDVLIEDIAHALSMTCRFNGHSKLFYSVAQHSVLASRYVNNNCLWALLHDAAEAYVGDLIQPLKRNNTRLGLHFCGIENKILKVVSIKFGLSPEIPYNVKQVDKRMLSTELRDVIGFEADSWGLDRVKPFDGKIRPWNHNYAKNMFLERFQEINK